MRMSAMTLREAAAELGISSDTLRQQIHKGKLSAQKVGRDWHLSRANIEAYRRDHLRGE